jgi:uncharacterized membrane protein
MARMPRRVEVSVAAELTADIVSEVSDLEGLIGLQVQAGASRKPPGDVIIVDVTNRAKPALLRLLARHGIGQSPAASFSTSEPVSIVSSSSAAAIAADSSAASWEEMDAVMAKNSNMTGSAMTVMGIAGVLATIGIAGNMLHVVVGAMLIAPGFQPIVRMAAAITSRGSTWRLGVRHLLQGYVALAAGAALTARLLQAMGKSALGSEASYLPAGVLMSYWTTLTVTGLIITAVAGTAGAILIATDRAVLTAGVMVALALVPGAALTGIGAATGDLELAANGAVRWLVEVALVFGASMLVLAWMQRRVHRRITLMTRRSEPASP